jgi:xylitol oxidase
VELTNWGGGYVYRAGVVHEPTTLEQVQELVASRPRLRVLGSRHSFTGQPRIAFLLERAIAERGSSDELSRA